MKKLLILMVAIMLPNMANAALDGACAAYWSETSCVSGYTYTMYGSTENSTSATTKCFNVLLPMAGGGTFQSGRAKVVTNVVCASGYTKKYVNVTNNICDNYDQSTQIELSYYECACSNTVTWGTWVAYGTGLERKQGTSTSCTTGATTTVYRYRCAAGYYSESGIAEVGKPLDITCLQCPTNAATCAAGSTTFTCNAGYYRFGADCTSCETTCGVGHTSVAGATSYAQCRAEASVTLDDGLGTFEYTTACCCDTTCDEKCESGKSCLSNADCLDGFCSDGCCVALNPCGLFSQCTSDSDCPGLQTCNEGCCGLGSGSILPNCARTSPDYCESNVDCLGGTCNTSTNCCEGGTETKCTVGQDNYCTKFISCKNTFLTCELSTNCCEVGSLEPGIK